MLYQRSRTSKSAQRHILPLFPLLMALFIVLVQPQMPAPLSAAAHAIASPIWHVRDNVYAGVGVTSGSLTSRKDLLRENQELREQLAQRERSSFVANLLIEENKELRNLLGRESSDNMYLPATVINDTTYSPYDSFVIDLGEVDGLRNNMLITTAEGVAVGTVTKTLSRSAVVTRFSAPNTEIMVTIQASSSVHALATGQGGGTMLLTIPRDIHVGDGDSVVLPNFPGNPLGTVVSIDMPPEAAYQTIYIQHTVNLHQLRYVLVDLVHTWKPEDNKSEEIVEDISL